MLEAEDQQLANMVQQLHAAGGAVQACLPAAPSDSCRLSANRGVNYALRCITLAHIEQQRRDGRVTLQVDEAQAVRQVTLSGSHEEQPAR